MAAQASFAQRVLLAQETRKRFVAEAGRAMAELATAVQERLTSLMNETAPSREMQNRRDAWTLYQSRQADWLDGTLKAWQAALVLPVTAPLKTTLDDGFGLVSTEVMENKITASRLVLGVLEKVSVELNDLRVRIKLLERLDELARLRSVCCWTFSRLLESSLETFPAFVWSASS